MPEKDKKENIDENRSEAEACEESQEQKSLEQQLEEMKQKTDEYMARWQRAQADFVNYKRRTEQERQEFIAFANATLLKDILPVIDDLERALENVPEDIQDHEWVKGIRLIERNLKTCLEKSGVKQILALGMEFDPNYHEALQQVEGPEGMVVSEFQKGYLLNDKLLRPARVMVGKGEEESKEENDNGKSSRY